MLSKVMSFGLKGIDGYPISVEADVYNGMPAYELVGLPDAAVKESKERVRSAIKNSGFLYPAKRITINLAPADLKKEGPIYDLPIAIGLLAASEQLRVDLPQKTIMLGELSLNGEIKPVNGILPMVIEAAKRGFEVAAIPAENALEAAYVKGIKLLPVHHLKQLADILNQEEEPDYMTPAEWTPPADPFKSIVDFKEIKGQEKARRAVEIAAAGGHNILLIGSPGSGKSMIAKALPGILPDFTFDEAIEVTKIHSIAGELQDDRHMLTVRPFRSPHHTASAVSITGGGTKSTPGEISLAHRGVLYFDELPEFRRDILESLRQPLEDGKISISRANLKVSYPADFMFVASMNPCPCGNFGSDNECRCSSHQIARYLSRISGPLLDRIDLHVEMGRVKYQELNADAEPENSESVRQRVNAARTAQVERYRSISKNCNAQLSSYDLKEYCNVGNDAKKLLQDAYDRLGLSARSYTRVLTVARTIADLDQKEEVNAAHVAEAIQYRSLDRKYWGTARK